VNLTFYENSGLGFSLQHPHGWTVNEGFKRVVFALPTSEPLEHLSVGVSRFERSISLDDLVRQSIADLQSNSDFELLSSERSVLTGMPSHTLVFTRTVRGHFLKIMQVLSLRDPSTGLLVTFKATPPRYDTFLDAARAVMGSFALVPFENIIGWSHDVTLDKSNVSLVFTTTRVIVVPRGLPEAPGFGLSVLRKLDSAVGIVDATGIAMVAGWGLGLVEWELRRRTDREIKEEAVTSKPKQLLAADNKNYALAYSEIAQLLVELPPNEGTGWGTKQGSLVAVTPGASHRLSTFDLRFPEQKYVEKFDRIVQMLQHPDLLGSKLKRV
jgi:hypothetical protein